MIQGKYCVLVVEDQIPARKALVAHLKGQGFVTFAAEDGEQALELYAHNSHKIDMVLLDIVLPVLDGFAVLAQLRKISRVPVIILSAKSSEDVQIDALLRGADDYLVKPYSMRMLLARMQCVLSRCTEKVKKVLRFGCLEILPSNRQVKVCGQEVVCTQKEYDLLFYFCDNHGITVSREQILDGVWGYDYIGDLRTVDTHVKQLRAKFSNTCLNIATVRGVGYRFEMQGELFDENGMCIQRGDCQKHLQRDC